MKISDKLYNALNGKYPERDYKVEAKLHDSERTHAWSVTSYKHHFPTPSKWGRRLDREDLEALILIPEDEGLIEVERVNHHGAMVHGFFAPEYPEEVTEAIYGSYAKKFAEPSVINEKYGIFLVLIDVVGQTERFQKYKEQVIEGIDKAEDINPYDNEEIMDCLGWCLWEKAGFNGSDEDLVKSLWSRAKTSPSGYTRRGVQEFFADYLIKNNPEILTKFDYIKDGIRVDGLRTVLGTIPTNPEAKIKIRDVQYHGSPSREVWKPILEYIDNAITGGK